MKYTDWVPIVFAMIQKKMKEFPSGHGPQVTYVTDLVSELDPSTSDATEVQKAVVNARDDLIRLGLVHPEEGISGRIELTPRGANVGWLAPRLTLDDRLVPVLRAFANAAVRHRDQYALRTIVDGTEILMAAGLAANMDETEDLATQLPPGFVEITLANQYLGIEPLYPAFSHFGL